MDSKNSTKNISVPMEQPLTQIPELSNVSAETHTLKSTTPTKPRSRGKRTPTASRSPALRSKTPTKEKSKEILPMSLDTTVSPLTQDSKEQKESSEQKDTKEAKAYQHVSIQLPESAASGESANRGITNVMPESAASGESANRGITFVMPEPLLDKTDDRFVIFPIRHPDVWDMYKKHMAVHWVPEEVDLSKDMAHWEQLSDNERYFIKNILGFFAGSDGIVMENLATRFMREVQWPEAKFFYSCQNLLEAVHSETYSLLIDTYITDKEEKTRILKSIQTIPCVQKKAEWALQWIDSPSASFATRLLAFAAVEGIFFSGAFCAIFWLKQRGVMPGLTVSNEFIARDEGLHTDFACLLYTKLNNKLPKKEATKIIRDAVKIEKQFITKSLPCDLIGMNAELMKQYIEFVADRLLLQLGYPKAYSAANPFPFMDRIGLEGKDNFFEKRVTTYGKAMVGKDKEKMVFSMTSDF